MLPSIDIARNAGMPYTDYEEYLLNTPESDYFRGLDDLVRPDDTFDVPALYMDSWYDYGPRNTLKMFNQMINQLLTISVFFVRCEIVVMKMNGKFKGMK